MSKYVKNLISDHIRDSLDGVQDALLVNMIGLDANANNNLRAELEAKDISVMVVKNSMAARATADTPLGPMFDGINGSSAVCWGSEDIVSLAKEVVRLSENPAYAAFEARGGVLDGEQLSADKVKEVSKWPSRQEQLSLLVGQILGPGSQFSGQLIGPGGALASQIEQKAEETAA
ncbi:MAG: 50S ribosomal protein L10 [Planctomycetia bacterium]|jgi:ribosomal protein L10